LVDHNGTTQPAWIRLNNVTELRLLFAASVMISHAATLLNPEGYRLLRTFLNSEAAVQGFFILSGYLVCGSYDRLRNARHFYVRRFMRIYPAYFVAVILFIALGIVQAMMLGNAVRWADAPLYLISNLATLNFLKPNVEGVFADNPLTIVNGALWSIKVEAMFYVILPLLYHFASRYSFLLLTLVMITAGAIWWPAITSIAGAYGQTIPVSFKLQLPGQLHYFGLGIALFARSKGLISTVTLALIVTFAIAILLALDSWREARQVVALVLVIGTVSILPQVKDMLRGQDISYGIYLCHFPLIQLLIAGGFRGLPLLLYLIAIVLLSVGYGLLSWRLIE
ncbi:MAG TPA: acyltransferase, partial [Nitrospira sp.]|nr:acyltransferase [Nitrospira sp.]